MTNARILVADDEEMLRMVAVEVLRRNFKTASFTEVDNGSDALEQVRTGNYDVLLTDEKMPGMRGLDLVRKIRAEGKQLTILLHSGTAHLDEVLEAGADGFLQKPYTNDELVAALQQAQAANAEKFKAGASEAPVPSAPTA